MSAGLVGALYYSTVIKEAPGGDDRSSPLVAVAESRRATGQAAARERTRTPIRCSLPDGAEFWTNAARCEDADLDNRLSVVQPGQAHLSPRRESGGGSARRRRSAPQGFQAPPLPQGTPVSCRFPIGRAQEIDRASLRLKDDPTQSVWWPKYCRWACEAYAKGCASPATYLQHAPTCRSQGCSRFR